MGERRKRSDALANDLREVMRLLLARLRATSADEAFSMSQAAVISRLYRHGPSTVADLARAEHVKPQSMGATVTTLEEEGFLVRTVDPADARRWHADLTEKGRRTFLAGREARQTWLSNLVHGRLDDEAQKKLATGIAVLRELLDEDE